MKTLILLIFIIILIIFSIAKWKLHPFLVLLLAGLILGYSLGMNSTEVINKLLEGFGDTLTSIGIVIAFGTVIGTFLEKSGGAQSIAQFILKKVSYKRSLLAMNITGFIISIPVFCDSGFIILSSLNKAISKRTKVSLVSLAIALATGLYATHVLVVPTPGPLAASATLGAEIGIVLLLSLVVAVPVSFIGFIWAKYFCNKYIIDFTIPYENNNLHTPKTIISILPILIPIILISLKSIADYPAQPFGNGFIKDIFIFFGHPVIALLIGVLLAFPLHKQYARFIDKTIYESNLQWFSYGLKEAGVIILITGAGGALGNILRSENLKESLFIIFNNIQIGIFFPFFVAAILKTAQGSSTVAMITASAIISPLLEPMGFNSQIGKALVVLAIGSGSMMVSHVNDSYFWVISQFSGMDTTLALKTFSVVSFFQGIVGIIVISLLQVILI